MRLKIKQSYLGNNEYKYELHNHNECLGELIKEFDWRDLQLGNIVQYGAEKYRINKVYDCELSPEQDEVIIYDLTPILVDIYLELW